MDKQKEIMRFFEGWYMRPSVKVCCAVLDPDNLLCASETEVVLESPKSKRHLVRRCNGVFLVEGLILDSSTTWVEVVRLNLEVVRLLEKSGDLQEGQAVSLANIGTIDYDNAMELVLGALVDMRVNVRVLQTVSKFFDISAAPVKSFTLQNVTAASRIIQAKKNMHEVNR